MFRCRRFFSRARSFSRDRNRFSGGVFAPRPVLRAAPPSSRRRTAFEEKAPVSAATGQAGFPGAFFGRNPPERRLWVALAGSASVLSCRTISGQQVQSDLDATPSGHRGPSRTVIPPPFSGPIPPVERVKVFPAGGRRQSTRGPGRPPLMFSPPPRTPALFPIGNQYFVDPLRRGLAMPGFLAEEVFGDKGEESHDLFFAVLVFDHKHALFHSTPVTSPHSEYPLSGEGPWKRGRSDWTR